MLERLEARNLTTYAVTDLGAAFGFRVSHLFALGGHDLVAGDVAVGGYPGIFHAFLASDGAWTDLGALGGDNSFAYGANASGQVVGKADLPDGSTHAFHYRAGRMTDLGTFGGSFSKAQGINASGQVAGWASTGAANHAALWSGDMATDLGTLGGLNSFATALNDSGQVVGYADRPDGSTHATLWWGGRTFDLGALGGGTSLAEAVNSSGQVVGYSTLPAGERRGFLWSDKTMTDLGTLPGYRDSLAYGINAPGEVVGDLHTGTSIGHAFVYRDGTMAELTDLLEPGCDATILSARAIDDAGRIVGWGRRPEDGFDHAYLLTPDDGPAGVGLGVLAFAGVPAGGPASDLPDWDRLEAGPVPGGRPFLPPTGPDVALDLGASEWQSDQPRFFGGPATATIGNTQPVGQDNSEPALGELGLMIRFCP